MTTEGSGSEPQHESLAVLRGVLARAKAGDAAALPRLREILDHSPALVARYGDLARQAEAAWVALASGSNLYLRESVTRAAEARRAELARPGASPVERLLAGRVVACEAELNYFRATEAQSLAAGCSHRQLQFHARRVERAQRMLLAATGALVTFQRLTPVPVRAEAALELAAAERDGTREASAGAVSPAPPAVVWPLAAEEPESAQADERERLRVSLG